MNEKITFKCKIIRGIYNSETFKCYAVDVDKHKYPFVKLTKYGNTVICGDIQTLAQGQEYEITGVGENTKNGYSYKVINIRRDKPHTEMEMQAFLEEILAPRQASELFKAYPNIVDKIIQNDYSDIDLSKVYGIKEKTFVKIVEKVKDNYSLIELVGLFKGVLNISILKKLYSKYASAKVVENKLQEDGYKCLCGISRVGFKMADGLLQELEQEKIVNFNYDLKTSPQRCLSCVLYLLEENEAKGNTKMNIKRLKSECNTLVPECSVHFVSAVKNDRIFYDKKTLMVGLKSTYDTEKYIADHIKVGLKNNIVWNYDIEKYRDFDGGSLTDEQVKALQNICKYNISILNGAGGTGKSQTSNAIIKMLQDNHKSFMLFAPTGRASKVLSGYTKQKASTIHRGLGFKPPNKWAYGEECKLTCDVLIIDEFSMTDIFIAKRVFEALDLTKTKLLIIGDNSQLPSVSCGNLLHDLMMSNIIPTTILTRVFRYGEGGLMTVATDVRNCKQYFKQDTNSEIEFYGKNKDYIFINSTPANIIKNTIGLYKKLLSQGNVPSDIQVLTAYNKGDYGTVTLNNHIQKIANKNYGNTKSIKVGEVTYYVGDIVIQKKNNYEAELVEVSNNIDFENITESTRSSKTFVANGETGIITDINGYYLTIDFDGNKVIYYRDDMFDVGLGYSISVHKCITEDTFLYSTKGLIQLKDLNNKAAIGEHKLFSDDVYLYNGDKVEKAKSFYNAGISDCKKIITKRGYTITGTLDHKIDILDKNGFIKQKEFQELAIEDKVLICKNINVYSKKNTMPNINFSYIQRLDTRENHYKHPVEMTNDFALFLGLMCSGGHVRRNKQGIAYSKNQKEVLNLFVGLLENLFGYEKENTNVIPNGVLDNTYRVEINSRYIANYLCQIGGIQTNKKYVPECILKSKKEIQCSFLKGLFEATGVNIKNDSFEYIEFSTKHEILIKQIQMMLLNIGVMSTVKKNNIENTIDWYLYMYKNEARLFEKNIGFISNSKNEKLRLCNTEKSDSDKEPKPHRDDVYVDSIDVIEDTKEQCYCLEMPITHKFVQNGFIGSNCQGGSSKIIILITPSAHTYMLNSNLIYVGLTRMKEKCFHLGDKNTVNRAIKKKENFDRNTFMQELLKEN